MCVLLMYISKQQKPSCNFYNNELNNIVIYFTSVRWASLRLCFAVENE